MPIIPVLVVLAACVAGCASVEVSHVGGRTVCVADNTSWSLFGFIPLGSGDPARYNRCAFLPFRDRVGVAGNIAMVEEAVKREGADGFVNLLSHSQDENVMLIFLRRHVLETSAELTYGGKPGIPGTHDCISSRGGTKGGD